MDNGSKLFFGFLTGVVAGFTAGILLSSDERKERVKKQVEDLSKNLRADLSVRLDEGLKKLNEITSSAVENVSEYANKLIQKDKSADTTKKGEKA